MRKTYNNRWYDKYPDLRIFIEKLKDIKAKERDTIISEMKGIIESYDDELFDRHVVDYPMTCRRRWYDKDPFSWLVINGLKYANEDLITDIILYLREKL